MKVVVVGGAGFVGTNLVRRLAAAGHEVIVFDDFSTGSMDGIPSNVNVLEGDIAAIGEAGQENDVFANTDVFVNCACVHIRKSVETPENDERVHVHGTVRLLEEARRIEAKVVYISSCSVYGQQAILPIDENAPLRPFTPYSAGKLGGESYALAYDAHGWVPVTVLRPSNIYGPWQDTSLHAGVTGLFIDAKIKGEKPFIHGDGSATRDFTYVEDFVDAIMLSLDTKEVGPFNVASGVETSISTLAEIVGVKCRVTQPHSVDRVSRRCLSVRRIKDKLGWTPKTSLADGIALTEEWMR